MLWKRLLFGTLMIAAVAGIAALDGWLSAGAMSAARDGMDADAGRATLTCGLPIMFLVMVLVVLATYELGRLCRAGGHRPATHWAAFVSALLAITPWIEMQQRISLAGPLVRPLPGDLSLPVVLLAGGVLGTCLVVLLRKTTEQAVSNMGITLLMVLYLGLLGSFLVRLRCLRPGPAGAALAILFLLTVKSGDIGAYFVGKLLGKNKLAPWLSPGKTVEGVVGAVVLAAGVAVGGINLWHHAAAAVGPPPLNFTQVIIFAAVMAMAGHLGDLVESAIKRDAGSKDSGQVVPAFGGLLDLLDSPIFAAPIAWWLLTRWADIG